MERSGGNNGGSCGSKPPEDGSDEGEVIGGSRRENAAIKLLSEVSKQPLSDVKFECRQDIESCFPFFLRYQFSIFRTNSLDEDVALSI